MAITTIFIFQSESPSGSDLNALGVYLLCSLAFLVCALIEFGFVVLLSRAPSTFRKNAMRTTTSTYNPLAKEGLRRRNVTKIDEALTEPVETREKEKCIFSIPPIHVVDIISFWVFLFSYLIFNCIYWLHYLSA